jgi:hypothetical protein
LGREARKAALRLLLSLSRAILEAGARRSAVNNEEPN